MKGCWAVWGQLLGRFRDGILRAIHCPPHLLLYCCIVADASDTALDRFSHWFFEGQTVATERHLKAGFCKAAASVPGHVFRQKA